MLRGRRQQVGALDGLLADVRAGRSRALVVRGEQGIGKTALLSYVACAGPEFQVARAEGVESEMELPYSALHQLCGRMLHRLDRLPSPQRDALSVALGLRSASAPDRFLVNLAVLGLLSDVAAEQPLLCLIDDAQWLDQTSAQALAFVARRLDTESVAVIFGMREPAGDDLTGLPELTLEGLSDADALVLLASVIPGRLDERVRDRVDQVGAAERPADAGAAKPIDRLAIEALGSIAVAQQRLRARLDAQRPIGATCACRLREPLERIGSALVFPAAGGRLDQLDQTPGGEEQLLRVLAGPLGRGQCLPVSAEAVVELRARPRNSGQSNALASARARRPPAYVRIVAA